MFVRTTDYCYKQLSEVLIKALSYVINRQKNLGGKFLFAAVVVVSFLLCGNKWPFNECIK